MCPRSIGDRVTPKSGKAATPGRQAGSRPRCPAAALAGRSAGRTALARWGGLPSELRDHGLLLAVAVELERHLVAGLLARDQVAQLLEGRHALSVRGDDDVAVELVALALDDHGARAGPEACFRGAAPGRDVLDEETPVGREVELLQQLVRDGARLDAEERMLDP